MRRSTATLPSDAAIDAVPEGSAVVLVDPAKLAIPIPPGMNLMAAAQQAGVRWPNVCGGQAQCGVCAVEVLEGAACLPAPALAERQMLARAAARPRLGGTLRLACQLVPSCALRVSKPGVRDPGKVIGIG